MPVVVETLVLNASDSLDVVEGSGLVETRATVVEDGGAEIVTTAVPRPPLVTVPAVSFSEAPRDLRSVFRPGRVILWRTRPRTLMRVVSGAASEADLERPAEPAYALAGTLDCGQRYIPRTFRVDAGGAAGHELAVYAAPGAVMPDRAGVISASLRFGDDPAAFALVTVRVLLPVANPAHTADRTFRGQADGRGELRLALTGLPAPTRAQAEADALGREAVVTVAADPALTGSDTADPDTLPAARLVGPAGGDPAPSATFTIRPGGIVRLASPGRNHLSLAV